jgi:hypothetical protein
MRPNIHHARRAALALAVLAAAPACLADTANALVTKIMPGNIEVASNGTVYTTPVIPLVSLTAHVKVEIDTGAVGHVKSWSAHVAANADAPGQTGLTVQFSQHKYNKAYPAGSRPGTVSDIAVVNVPYGSLAGYLTGQCNYMANALRAGGMTNAQIFAQDRKIAVAVLPNLAVDTSGAGQGSIVQEVSYHRSTFDLVCKAHAVHTNPAMKPATGLQAGTQARLTAITASVLHAQHPAACPAEATARFVFTSDTPGPFTWQIRSSASHKASASIRLEMGPGDKQGTNYVKVYDQKFMIGATPAPAGGSGEPVGGSAVSKGGLASPTLPSEQRPGGGGIGQQQAAGAYAGAVSNVFQDALRAVVLNAAQGSVQQSGPAGYLVNCPTPQATPAHQAAGAFQPQRAPQVAPPAAPALAAPAPAQPTPAVGLPARPAAPATPPVPAAPVAGPAVKLPPPPGGSLATPQREAARR